MPGVNRHDYGPASPLRQEHAVGGGELNLI